MMDSFTAEDWFEIKGRGWACAVREKLPPHEYDPNNYKGKKVKIDGKTYKVEGVETFAIPRSKEHPYLHNFALLVDGKV